MYYITFLASYCPYPNSWLLEPLNAFNSAILHSPSFPTLKKRLLKLQKRVPVSTAWIQCLVILKIMSVEKKDSYQRCSNYQNSYPSGVTWDCKDGADVPKGMVSNRTWSNYWNIRCLTSVQRDYPGLVLQGGKVPPTEAGEWLMRHELWCGHWATKWRICEEH